MSSKFGKQFQIPPEFPEILKDFAREVLRQQPENINEFAAKYFDCLAQGLPAEGGAGGIGGRGGGASANAEPEMSLDEVEEIIQDLFHKYDQDGNGYLDPVEFKSLMTDLQQRLDFPPDEILLFLAEADMNQDGMIEYEEFIPLALQVIQGMYAKKRLEQHTQDIEQHAEDLLVHGMSREELKELVESIFSRMDEDNSGTLSKSEFMGALQSMELGLTRREINTIMFKIDSDNDNNISYREFVPFAFDLLQKLTSLRLLETELENDNIASWLMELFRGRDTEMTGMLHVDDVRDLLHKAMLGLSRMQIYTVISEADVNSDMLISYAAFIPRAVGLIRSMLSFEASINRESKDIDRDAENSFFMVLDESFVGMQTCTPDEFMSRLEASNVLEPKEFQAARNFLVGFGDTIPVEEAKADLWKLLKSLRRMKAGPK
jgi:Ca2+-binding EF-hand superfamily protein